MSEITALGLADPVFGSQTAFRHILAAMSSPGHVATLPHDLSGAPEHVSPAAAAILLTLCDYDMPVFSGLNSDEFESWLRFYTGTHLVTDLQAAKFAVIKAADSSLQFDDFNLGDARYPDLSATLIIECAALYGGQMIRISGPGIQGTRAIAPLGLHARFWQNFTDQAAFFPLGVDLILTAGQDLLALPRSVRIEESI